MATAKPPHLHPVLDALAGAPLGEEDMTPEQEAELAEIVVEYEAGRARLVPHEDVPAVLEELSLYRDL